MPQGDRSSCGHKRRSQSGASSERRSSARRSSMDSSVVASTSVSVSAYDAPGEEEEEDY